MTQSATDTSAPEVVFDHLRAMTDGRGLFEHSLGALPRRESGYCTDDVARALVVVCRDPDPGLQELGAHYLAFTLAAVTADGRCHNRMNIDGVWTDEPSLGDWWGRAAWGLGSAAAHAHTPQMRADALTGFRRVTQQRSLFRRSMAFAGIGAAEVLLKRPRDPQPRALLAEVARTVGKPELAQPGLGEPAVRAAALVPHPRRGAPAEPVWPWPEARLTYGNATITEALLLAGTILPDTRAAKQGLELLDFLLAIQTHKGHLSPVPAGGRGPQDDIPGFDQQPIEVAALADACSRAFEVTKDEKWRTAVRLAWAWFLGHNDSSTAMVDLTTGSGYDGLQLVGRNDNRGAESTLAMLSTAQQARRLGVLL